MIRLRFVAMIVAAAIVVVVAITLGWQRSNDSDRGDSRGRPADPAPLPRDRDPGSASRSTVESSTNPAEVPGRRLVLRLGDVDAANAEIFAFPWDDESRARAVRRLGIEPSWQRQHVVPLHSDDHGRLELPAGSDRWFVAARATGSAPSGFVVDATTPQDGVLALTPEQIVTGRTIGGDAAQAAVAGARVIGRFFYHEGSMSSARRADPGRIASMFFLSETVSEADGTFRLAGMPVGRSWLQARAADGRAGGMYGEVIPAKVEPVIRMFAGATVRGLVVDDLTGRPIENARVLWTWRSQLALSFDLTDTRTDADGRFALTDVNTEFNGIGLRVDADGHASDDRQLPALKLSDVVELVIRLGPQCPQEVLVRTESGAPVSGAKTSFSLPVTCDAVSTGFTDENGIVEAEGLAAGTAYQFSVTAAGFAAQFVAGIVPPVSRVVIVMRPTGAVTGVLRGESLPLVDPYVRFALESATGRRWLESWIPVDPHTGTFHSGDLQPGSYRVDASAEHYGMRTYGPFVVKSGGEPLRVEIPLERGAVVRGRVTDAATGAPLVGARVTVADRTSCGDTLKSFTDAVETDADGRYTIEDIETGSVLALLVEPEGRPRVVSTCDVPRGAAEAHVDIAVPGPAALTITVKDSTGASGFVASVLTSDQQLTDWVEAGGSRRIDRLPPGATHVWGSTFPAPGSASRPQSFDRTVLLAPGGEQTLVIEVNGGATIAGHVTVDGSDATAQNLLLTCHDDGPTPILQGVAILSPDGAYRIDHVPPGPHTLQLRSLEAERGVRVVKGVDVPAAGVVTVDFSVTRTGVAGSVRDESGAAVPFASIRLRPSATTSAKQTVPGVVFADGEGAFSLTGLDPGAWDVAASGPGLETASRECRIDAAAPNPALDFMLKREAILRIRVTRPDGASEPTAVVRTTSLATDDPFAVPPAERVGNEWIVHGLAAGEFRVRATAGDFFPAEGVATCVNGAEASLALALRRRGALCIRVRGPQGNGLAHVVADAIDRTTGRRLSEWVAAGLVTLPGGSSTDASGELRITGIPEGRYQIEAAGFTASTEVIAGEDEARATILVGG